MSLPTQKYPNPSRTISGANNTVFADDVILMCDTTTAPVSLNLQEIPPSNWSVQYKLYVVDKVNNAATNNITINAPIGTLINNASSLIISSNLGCILIQICSDTNYVATKSNTQDVSGYTTVQNQTDPVLTQQSTIQFVGAGVIASNDVVNNKTVVTINGGASNAYSTIQNPVGTAQTQRNVVQFAGAGVSVSDDVVNAKTIVSIDATPYVLPTATALIKGGVKIGNNVTVDGSGLISVEVGDATTIGLVSISAQEITGVKKFKTGINMEALVASSILSLDSSKNIANVSGTGLVRMTGGTAYSLDSNTYLTQAYTQIKNDGTSITPTRSNLNFIGDNVNVADNGTDTTNVTITKGLDTLEAVLTIRNSSLSPQNTAFNSLEILTTVPSTPSVGFVTITFATQSSAPFNTSDFISISGQRLGLLGGYNGGYVVVSCTTSSLVFASSAVMSVTVQGFVNPRGTIHSLPISASNTIPRVGQIINGYNSFVFNNATVVPVSNLLVTSFGTLDLVTGFFTCSAVGTYLISSSVTLKPNDGSSAFWQSSVASTTSYNILPNSAVGSSGDDYIEFPAGTALSGLIAIGMVIEQVSGSSIPANTTIINIRTEPPSAGTAPSAVMVQLSSVLTGNISASDELLTKLSIPFPSNGLVSVGVVDSTDTNIYSASDCFLTSDINTTVNVNNSFLANGSNGSVFALKVANFSNRDYNGMPYAASDIIRFSITKIA
jgi:hypothetical protein